MDSTFIEDGEIFPFASNDTIYSLSISGTVRLLSDTSLVRVILADTSGHEWMIYEAYSMILPGKYSQLQYTADETMYLRVNSSYSIKIQCIESNLYIHSIKIKTEYSENLESAQQSFKVALESRIVDSINYYIDQNQMLWHADTTQFSNNSYLDKQAFFGDKYNLMGLEYYVGGLYDPLPGIYIIGLYYGEILVDSKKMTITR